MAQSMSLLVLVSLLASQLGSISPPKAFFTAEDMAELREQAQKQCGYASPQELMPLSKGERQKILPCFIEATVERSVPFLPKIIEPGATIVSVTNFQGLPVFVVQFSADHPRASVPKNETSDYDRLLSNRTCDDKWLGGLIDAGMVDGAQAGAVIVYKLQTEKSENLAIVAVGQCYGPE